ncbi:ADR243Cp [Eremothecium gossypii ATCC 10895]|uniref:ADR243Cp n=1 Tax=Eremothecium gossypii (strain ATCC 10895 / CBS 109.51 / FGSC 9923 / NRRL Y-1056) TaxID=284811 RepID=Q759N2_EREGS|nr:ADR243Cp [Eremothecium gossypii ATCC 10895]AAS52163.1 ADR243Cp [Eremothecium gossypii ATCC 10895]AEY96462.1 FADR243Cp [Eremothecium gossypii FDAG1]
MVYFYDLIAADSAEVFWIVVGRNKEENDLLVKHGYRELNYLWFHVDKYASAHVYLKLHAKQQSSSDVPRDVLHACLQLCKSESVQGNKQAQCSIVSTPWHNLRKSGYMKPGEVSFKSTKAIAKLQCAGRDNKLLNQLRKRRIDIYDDVETLLRDAKRSKDGDFFIHYITANRERLLEEEKERASAKKARKRQVDSSELPCEEESS